MIRAQEDGAEKGKKIDDRKMTEQTNKLVEGMKKGGIDQSTAQRILDTWEQTGATSTDALRKMLLGRSLKTVGVVVFQLLLDGGAAYGSYNSARLVVLVFWLKLQLRLWMHAVVLGAPSNLIALSADMLGKSSSLASLYLNMERTFWPVTLPLVSSLTLSPLVS